MPETFWIEEYRKKAALPDAISQSGRGSTFQAVEFLYVVKQTIELLDLRREHDLLDVGCANGLLDIPLSACCRSVLAVEPVEELAERARVSLAGCENVRVRSGHAAELPVGEERFDRILLMGVFQLLSPRELPSIFAELRRVLRPGGRLLLGSIPDKSRQRDFLEPYLQSVRRAHHLSEEQKNAILTRNRNAQWYDADDLIARWRSLGGTARRHALCEGDPDRDHRFHLVVSFPE
jgi:cyclopropane fatty-acyl-phospholipid synthase-like methyltransferase